LYLPLFALAELETNHQGGLKNNPYYTSDELPLHTPNIDAIATRGTRFSRAFVGAPVCAPSRACLASGRYHDEAGLPQNFHNDYELNITTFYSVLRDNGYHTMITGRDDLDKSSGGPGDDGTKHTAQLGFSDAIRCDGSTDVTRGGSPHEPFGEWLVSQPVANKTVALKYNSTNLFDLQAKRFKEIGKYGGYAIPDPMPLPNAAYQDNWIASQALALLKRKPAGKPWFIEVSHQAPHPPMDITSDMMASVRNRTFPLATNSDIAAAKQQMGRQNYAAKIERLDYWLGQYVQLLTTSGEIDSTIICLCSDHGEMLFDRDAVAKSKPWSSASSVPLVCAGPGILPDRLITSPVSTVDLAATFIDIATLASSRSSAKKPPSSSAAGDPLPSDESPLPPGMTSRSLYPLLSGRTTSMPRTEVLTGLNQFRMVVKQLDPTDPNSVFKFVCCNGPCPGSNAADRAMLPKGWVDEYHLYNISASRWEDPTSDMQHAMPETLQMMAALLPPAHQTPDNPNSSIPNQGHGYRWLGCRCNATATAAPLSPL
jgi:arylsulfatase A-like enzyme